MATTAFSLCNESWNCTSNFLKNIPINNELIAPEDTIVTYKNNVYICYIRRVVSHPLCGWVWVWVVNLYSTTKTKQYTATNTTTMNRWAENVPGWQRHCDESVHWNSVRIIGQYDITIASGSCSDDVTITHLLSFEIVSGTTRNERCSSVYLRLHEGSKYKGTVAFFNGEYNQTLNTRPWFRVFQVLWPKDSAEPWIVWQVRSYFTGHERRTRQRIMSLIPLSLAKRFICYDMSVYICYCARFDQ